MTGASRPGAARAAAEVVGFAPAIGAASAVGGALDGAVGSYDPGGERQVPFFCPYCGEEDLRPAGNQGSAWDCLACRRGFRLSFAGLIS